MYNNNLHEAYGGRFSNFKKINNSHLVVDAVVLYFIRTRNVVKMLADS